MDKIIWLVIANAAQAKIFRVHKHQHSFVETLAHPESRLKSGEIASDRPGSYQKDNSPEGQYEAPTNPHDHEKTVFAREIKDYLEKARGANDFEALVLCAEPHFAGLLNEMLTPQTKALLAKTIHKDYIPLPKDKFDAVVKEIAQTPL